MPAFLVTIATSVGALSVWRDTGEAALAKGQELRAEGIGDIASRHLTVLFTLWTNSPTGLAMEARSMLERKAKRKRTARIVQEAAASPRKCSASEGFPRPAEYDLALKAACLAEATPREELVRRITVEWVRANGYMKGS